MNARVTQKAIRQLISSGLAIDANHLSYEKLYQLYPHVEKVCHSEGIYGINGGVVRDSRDGQMYAIPSRSSALFIFF